MIYLKKFDSHSSYETELNGGGGVDISLPNVSYCKDVKDVHYTPYNLVRFYVGEITPPQTVKIYTDSSTSVDVQVSEGNKWYSYVLPKDKGLYKISGDTITKVVVKADITTSKTTIIPTSAVEASFKGSNTSNVTDMNGMFRDCRGITSLVLSGWNTSKVTDMNGMFNYCRNLTSLDVSNFDTSKVTNMNSMFYGCRGITSLDLSNFNTSNVTNMRNMFNGCTNLTSLDVSNFNTSNVTDMGGMFQFCSNLTSLDLSNFNTSNVTKMGGMFLYNRKLTSLDLSGWDMTNVTDTSSMFDGCSQLTTIRMVGCSEDTINKIKAVKPSSATIITE